MITTRSSLDHTWTDLNSPTQDELDSLIMSENIDPLIAKDLLSPTPKQYCRDFGKSVYAIFHIPSFRKKHKESLDQEIDIVITKNGLVTTKYDSIDAIHHFAKEIEVKEILNKESGSHLLFGMMKEIYKFLFDELDYMKDWLKDIEKNIFNGHEKEMVWSISTAGRNLLGFKRTLAPHDQVWVELSKMGGEKFGKDFENDAIAMLDECRRLWSEIENLSMMVSELRETNNSMLSTKQNEIMRIFTILAFVTFPLSLVAAIFGMNTIHIPLIGRENDFWLVISLMIFMSLVMFGYFKYKKWI